MITRSWLGFLFASLTFAGSARAADESDLLPVTEAFALTTTVDSRDSVKIRFAIAEGYYLYRHRFAVANVDPAAKLAAFKIPDGAKKVDEFFGAVETYRGAVELTQALPAIVGDALQIEVRYQGCADVGVCYPPQKTRIALSLPSATAAVVIPVWALPSTTGPPGLQFGAAQAPAGLPGAAQDALPEDQAFLFEAIAAASDTLLARFSIAPGYYLYRDKTRFTVRETGLRLLPPQWPDALPHEDGHFGQVMVYFESIEVPIAVAHDGTAAQPITIDVEYQGCKDQGICYPVMRRSLALSLPAGEGALAPALKAAPQAALSGSPEEAPQMGLAAALLFALLGGLVLNLMPCVLPILSLKAMSLAQSGHSPGYARRNAIWYTLGVLVSFAVLGLTILALRAGGAALGWGFQLQQPAFVALLVYVMLALGLSMSGLIAFGSSLGGVGQSLTEDEGGKGAFFTGVLACIVASPCTAPFMGGALAYAIAQPPWIALAIFLTLGLGLALPFLLIGFVPAFARLLPRPGAWMETLKQALAFPMYLTGVWLLWVLGHQVGIDGAGAVLAGCVCLAMAIWWWERQRDASFLKRSVFALVLVAFAASALYFVTGLDAPSASASAGDSLSEPFSDERLAALQKEGRPVLVNMTADWCATCKVNERLVLSRDGFRDQLKSTNSAYLKGDWTNEDPVISAFLQRFKAVGVPLYVVFPAEGSTPQVLPSVLTSGTVEEALNRAAGKPAT